jgi:hypothetical protein
MINLLSRKASFFIQSSLFCQVVKYTKSSFTATVCDAKNVKKVSTPVAEIKLINQLDDSSRRKATSFFAKGQIFKFHLHWHTAYSIQYKALLSEKLAV